MVEEEDMVNKGSTCTKNEHHTREERERQRKERERERRKPFYCYDHFHQEIDMPVCLLRFGIFSFGASPVYLRSQVDLKLYTVGEHHLNILHVTNRFKHINLVNVHERSFSRPRRKIDT